jgi:hypothetical protein
MAKGVGVQIMKLVHENPDGFTARVRHGKVKLIKGSDKERYVVSLTNNNTKEKVAQFLVRLSKKSNLTIGGWRDSKSGEYYLDENIILSNKELALEIGKLHKQKAIFDLRTHKEIRL